MRGGGRQGVDSSASSGAASVGPGDLAPGRRGRLGSRRPAFAPNPLGGAGAEVPRGGPAHPLPLLLAFAALSLAVGFAWTWPRLLAASAAVLLWLLWPAPSRRPWRGLLFFLPMILLVPLLHGLQWRGFAGGLPWTWESAALLRGTQSALRLALWILVSARALERLGGSACMIRLPRNRRLARFFLAPVLALACLELSLREAWLLERAWRARGGLEGRNWRAAHWPSLILPLFRNLLARADGLAESLELRRFPSLWAGEALRLPGLGDILPLVPVLVLLIWLWP